MPLQDKITFVRTKPGMARNLQIIESEDAYSAQLKTPGVPNLGATHRWMQEYFLQLGTSKSTQEKKKKKRGRVALRTEKVFNALAFFKILSPCSYI